MGSAERIYISDPRGNSGMELLTKCEECFALVCESDVETHAEWHNEQASALLHLLHVTKPAAQSASADTD
jgi:hypothetical protein